MDRDTILRSIEPKSDQLNADDLIAGPIDVQVVEAKKGDKDQPICIVLDGDLRPYKPCKSMRRLLVALWGDTPADWIGKRMRLYCDPGVQWAGVKVGGIRISHVSGIQSRTSIMLTVTRGKRTEYVVEPMPEAKPRLKAKTENKSLDDRARACVKALNDCNTVELIDRLAARSKPLMDECESQGRKDLAMQIELALVDARAALEM